MAINKVIDRNGNTLIDLTNDTVSSNRVLSGTKFHGPDGKEYTGTLDPGPLEYSQYNFIDYDGTLLYSYTDEELDALTELPAGPDHTDDNLTFQEWNWSLEDLKAWDRTRPDRPLVGANLITTDGKSYLYLDTPLTGATLRFTINGTINSIDWGDGTVDTSTSHVYANPGQYMVIIDLASGYWFINNNSPSQNTNAQYIRKIKMGTVRELYSSGNFIGCYSLETISLPSNVALEGSTFYYCESLKAVVIPRSNTKLGSYAFYYCYAVNTISLNKNISNISGNSQFYGCSSLRNIVLPDGISKISGSMFYGTTMKEFVIPNSVTSIESNAFYQSYTINLTIPDSVTTIAGYTFSEHPMILDLSNQTKVITLTGNISMSNYLGKILVPSALLASYKSASYWSNYASIMVGV